MELLSEIDKPISQFLIHIFLIIIINNLKLIYVKIFNSPTIFSTKK